MTTSTAHRINNMTVLTQLYRLFLRQQMTRGRIVLAAVLGGLSFVIAFFMARELDNESTEAVIGFIWLFGLGLAVPIMTLVLASSTLGNLVEDETLVYLWMRPYPRWVLAVAAWLSAVTAAVPLTIIPFALTGALGSRGDSTTTLAAALAVALAVVAYSGLFTLLGLLTRWALIWGLVYIFIWETIVARFAQGAARLSVVSYPSSVLSRLTDVELAQADRAMAGGLIVPFVIAAVALALTAWRLDSTTVA